MASFLSRRTFLGYDGASAVAVLGTAAFNVSNTPAGFVVEDRRAVQDA